MTSFITTMFVSPPFPNMSPRALSPVFSSGCWLPDEVETTVRDEANSYCTVDLQQVLSSNARTRGQFKPRNASKGNSSYQLRQFAEATLGSGSLRKAVKLPEGEDLSEWLAVNGR